MSRLAGLVVLGCILALGCASSAPVRVARSPEHAAATVDAGPREGSACGALRQRIRQAHHVEAAEAHTLLDASVQMVEARRLRTLEARARTLGCPTPRG